MKQEANGERSTKAPDLSVGAVTQQSRKFVGCNRLVRAHDQRCVGWRRSYSVRLRMLSRFEVDAAEQTPDSDETGFAQNAGTQLCRGEYAPQTARHSAPYGAQSRGCRRPATGPFRT